MIKIRRRSNVPIGKLRVIKYANTHDIVWRFFRLRYSINHNQCLVQCGIVFKWKEEFRIFIIFGFTFGYVWQESSLNLYREASIALPWIYRDGQLLHKLIDYREHYACHADYMAQRRYLEMRKRRLK